MIFYKTVSAGNDFLHIDMEDFKAQYKDGRMSRGHLAERLCCRHTGAGADGVIFYTLGDTAVDFEIFNRDGSEAELSGNGMAGLSALLFNLGKAQDRVTLSTRAGKKTHLLLEQEKNTYKLKIDIGEPDFFNKDFFPFLEENRVLYSHEGIDFQPVSVGNPHVVVLPETELPEDTLNQMGAMLESAAIFPHNANVEFVFYKNEENCRVFYYERGVGPTISSSTGSAAVFAVLQKTGHVRDRLTIDTPEGKVKIYGKKSIYIENCSKIVYKCIYMG
jgi:diaminopimelate epimerase